MVALLVLSTLSGKKLVAYLDENNCQTSTEQTIDISLPQVPTLSSEDDKSNPISENEFVIPGGEN